jgi:hypothetical protein
VEKCRLLGEEVVIIDSPGIDVEADLGKCAMNTGRILLLRLSTQTCKFSGGVIASI